jgi:hypothetical protein
VFIFPKNLKKKKKKKKKHACTTQHKKGGKKGHGDRDGRVRRSMLTQPLFFIITDFSAHLAIPIPWNGTVYALQG